MGRPITVVVGPLATADPDGAAAIQTVPAAAYMALNGALTNGATANNVCASQTPAGAGNLVLNGTLASSVSGAAVAYLGSNQRIYFTSASNISNRTFTITGMVMSPSGLQGQTEVLTGPNNNTVASQQRYYWISQIAISGAAAGALTVGRAGFATFDQQRRVSIVSSADDTDITFTITGTDGTGAAITEVRAGLDNSTQTSLLSFKTITDVLTSGASSGTVTIGSSAVADSPYVRFDDYAANAQVAIQCTVSGTVNFDVEQTMDDPNIIGGPITPANMTWLNHPDSALANATATAQGNYAYPPIFARVTLNSGTGSVTGTFRQAYLA